MKKRKKVLIPVVALVVIGVIVRIVMLRSEFLYAGTIEATKVDVPARLASVIDTFDVKEGEKVAKDQALVHLSCEDTRLAADVAEGDYQRAERLYHTGSMPKETFDHLKNRRDDATLKQSWCVVKTPRPGTILSTYKEAGEWVSPGAKLLTLADLSEVWAIVYVPQPMLAKIALGQEVTGILADVKGRSFSGKITHISDEAEFTPKNVQTREERTRLVFGVKVTFANPDAFLKPGMPIEVRLPRL